MENSMEIDHTERGELLRKFLLYLPWGTRLRRKNPKEDSDDSDDDDDDDRSSSLLEEDPLFLGGLSLYLNHLIASRMTNYDWQFGTLPFGLFGSNLDTMDLETYPRTYSGHF